MNFLFLRIRSKTENYNLNTRNENKKFINQYIILMMVNYLHNVERFFFVFLPENIKVFLPLCNIDESDVINKLIKGEIIDKRSLIYLTNFFCRLLYPVNSVLGISLNIKTNLDDKSFIRQTFATHFDLEKFSFIEYSNLWVCIKTGFKFQNLTKMYFNFWLDEIHSKL